MLYHKYQLIFLILSTFLIGIIKSLPAEMEEIDGNTKGFMDINKLKDCPLGMISNFANLCNVMKKS